MKKNLIVTGAAGLIGSEVVEHLSKDYDHVYGVDNNQRKIFFGDAGNTTWRKDELLRKVENFTHVDLDIRNRSAVQDLISTVNPYAVVHCAAQPSHDLAASIPFDDFDVNANGTLNLLEAVRQTSKNIIFAHMSTNKVYGDAPNKIDMVELDTRWEYADKKYINGIPEIFTIDQSKHSLFGASKVAADIMVQEYGRYFDIKTCCLRGGCLTGPNHSGVELHGFLNYLVKANVTEKEYTIFGYKGKQVRDNIHSWDVANFIRHFIDAPRVAEVYNIGGGKGNSVSIIEAFKIAEKYSGKPMNYKYSEQARAGDHICYYSDLSKMRYHYPSWDITISVDETIRQIVEKTSA